MTTKEAIYDIVINETVHGLWRYDFKTANLLVSPSWKSILGQQEIMHELSIEQLKKYVHPDDLPKAVAGENPRDNFVCEKCLGRRR